VAIQGFGAVGSHAARFLQERGAIVVAVADIGGGIVAPEGLPLAPLLTLKSEGRSVSEFTGGRAFPGDELIGVGGARARHVTGILEQRPSRRPAE